jgi:hypothetical protein
MTLRDRQNEGEGLSDRPKPVGQPPSTDGSSQDSCSRTTPGGGGPTGSVPQGGIGKRFMDSGTPAQHRGNRAVPPLRQTAQNEADIPRGREGRPVWPTNRPGDQSCKTKPISRVGRSGPTGARSPADLWANCAEQDAPDRNRDQPNGPLISAQKRGSKRDARTLVMSVKQSQSRRPGSRPGGAPTRVRVYPGQTALPALTLLLAGTVGRFGTKSDLPF